MGFEWVKWCNPCDASEQAVSDGQGHLYVEIEDKNNVAMVDLKTLKVIAHYDIGGIKTPAGLGMDIKIVFYLCFVGNRQPL